jgi:hypothetical protein
VTLAALLSTAALTFAAPPAAADCTVDSPIGSCSGGDCAANAGYCDRGNCAVNGVFAECNGFTSAGSEGSCTVNLQQCNGYYWGTSGTCTINAGDCSGTGGRCTTYNGGVCSGFTSTRGGNCTVNAGSCTGRYEETGGSCTVNLFSSCRPGSGAQGPASCTVLVNAYCEGSTTGRGGACTAGVSSVCRAGETCLAKIGGNHDVPDVACIARPGSSAASPTALLP